MRLNLEKNYSITLDLHSMQASEAKRYLDQQLSDAPRELREIEVIHGYRGGTALMQLVRNSYKHPRLKSKIIGLNQGSTTYILK